MTVTELFCNAYAESQLAADDASAVWNSQENKQVKITQAQARKWRQHLSAANSALIALEDRMKGNPEPKRGE